MSETQEIKNETQEMGNEKEHVNLYVLRYAYSGNYYVGTAEDFEERMLTHWRRHSPSSNSLPHWSYVNRSIDGFIFYWFTIETDGVSQSCADQCENHLAKLLTERIKDKNDDNFIKEVHVGNNGFVDGIVSTFDGEKFENIDIKPDETANKLNDIDKEIAAYLTGLKSLKPQSEEKELSIECCKTGCFGKYDHTQCNESFCDVVKPFAFS